MRKTLWLAVVLAAALISLGVVTAASGNSDKAGGDSGKTEEADKKGHEGNDDGDGKGEGGNDKVQVAEGANGFTLNFTCNAGQPGGEELPPCAFDEATNILTIKFVNSNTYTGTFDGDGIFIADFFLNVVDNTFTQAGHAVFSGKVKGCGRGMVIFDNVGSGQLGEDGTADFETNDFTIINPPGPGGTTLDIEGFFTSRGPLPTDENAMGSGRYEGEITCERQKSHHGHRGGKHHVWVHGHHGHRHGHHGW